MTESGKLFAWGLNSYGQTGSGDNYDKLVPSEVNYLKTGVSKLYINGAEITNFTQIDDNTIEFTAPAHTAGKVDIKVTNSLGQTFVFNQGYEYISDDIEAPNTGTAN